MPASMNTGIAYALGAFVLWGLLPLYFKQIASVPALVIDGRPFHINFGASLADVRG